MAIDIRTLLTRLTFNHSVAGGRRGRGLLLPALMSALVPLSLSGCATKPDGHEAMLGDWLLARWVLDGEPAPVQLQFGAPTLLVNAEGGISGFAGVNRYNGQLAFAGDNRLVVEPRLMTTKRAGPPAAMQQEKAWLAFVTALDAYSIENGRLMLVTDSGDRAEMARNMP